MTMETKPTSSIEKFKYLNRIDEAYEALCMHISLELLFHVSSFKTPNEIWTTMGGIFDEKYDMRGHMLEVELLALNLKRFENIQDFFTRYKDLLMQLKACGVHKSKEEKRMVLTILSKLGPDYSIFVSILHTQRLSIEASWTMPSLDTFIEDLI
jgi:hypothetical protein